MFCQKNNRIMNRKQNNSVNFFVEKLTLFDVCYFIFKGSLSNIEIYYDKKTVSSSAKSLLGAYNKLSFCKNFHSLDLSFDKKDSSGNSINYSFLNDFDVLREDFCNQHIGGESRSFKNMVKQCLAWPLYFRAVFITMVENHPKFIEMDKPSNNIFYLVQHPLNPVLFRFYRKKGYRCKQSFISLQTFKYYLRPLYHLAIIFLEKLNFKKVETNIYGDIRHSVWVEYSKGIIDFTFWSKNIRENNFDIVYYFDRADDASVFENAADVETRGFKWINLHFYSLIKLAKLGFSDLKELMSSFILSPCKTVWFRIFNFENKMWFLLYRKVFKSFKVKVLIQHQETSWVQEPQVKALESAGGVMFAFHWSNYPFYSEALLTPMHVLFVWGEMIAEAFRKKGNTCRYILPLGLWDFPSNKGHEEMDSFTKGRDFVLAIFDNATAYNIPYSPKSLAQFYEKILRMLEENQSWAGIMKSKRGRMSDVMALPGGSDIYNKILSLINERKLLVLDPDTKPSFVLPYAHISVCYCISSVGIISGLYGYPAVHWDPVGCLRHPFYRDNTQKFIYPDLNSFEEAIIQFSRGNREIGNFAKWRRRFNYFDDFKASERIGKFIDDFMQTVDKTQDAIVSLDEVVTRYLCENKVGNDFFDSANAESGYK